jgi:hypothetical protein
MATSPNFNWPEPDNTDLVRNGALAIRTAVDAIDTSLVDLKGGTTGQVLAKASGTDMDFSWVAQDDSNAIQNAIVDAKGDLIAASAADTPARLAVGTNNYFLQAQSAEATGLKWAGAEISYTPVWEATGTAPSLGNGQIDGSYVRIGDVVSFRIRLQIRSTTTMGTGSYFFTLPIAMSSASKGFIGNALILDAGVAWYLGYEPTSVIGGTTNKFQINRYDGSTVGQTTPITFGTDDNIYVWGQYNV